MYLLSHCDHFVVGRCCVGLVICHHNSRPRISPLSWVLGNCSPCQFTGPVFLHKRTLKDWLISFKTHVVLGNTSCWPNTEDMELEMLAKLRPLNFRLQTGLFSQDGRFLFIQNIKLIKIKQHETSIKQLMVARGVTHCPPKKHQKTKKVHVSDTTCYHFVNYMTNVTINHQEAIYTYYWSHRIKKYLLMIFVAITVINSTCLKILKYIWSSSLPNALIVTMAGSRFQPPNGLSRGVIWRWDPRL